MDNEVMRFVETIKIPFQKIWLIYYKTKKAQKQKYNRIVMILYFSSIPCCVKLVFWYYSVLCVLGRVYFARSFEKILMLKGIHSVGEI
jgi:hypothetical protein